MPSREPSRYFVLCGEDNEAQRYAAARLLRQAGFEVAEASTGEEALRLALSRSDTGNTDHPSGCNEYPDGWCCAADVKADGTEGTEAILKVLRRVLRGPAAAASA